MAAVLAVGGGAALSHGSAAALWGMLRPTAGAVDVSVPSLGGRRRRSGIRLHRCASLRPRDLTRRLGIPVTTPARTIDDLRIALPPYLVRQAVRQAQLRGLPLDEEPTDGTRSELERRFLRLCRRSRLPPPEVNARVGPLTVDFLWAEARLIVETDGYRYHRGRAAFEDDRDRDLLLRGLGHEVIRLTYRQVVEEPQRVAEVLRAALSDSPLRLAGRPRREMRPPAP